MPLEENKTKKSISFLKGVGGKSLHSKTEVDLQVAALVLY